jgi:hypothetical protein
MGVKTMRVISSKTVLGGLAAALVGLGGMSAEAAPQVLALAASGGTVPLQCDGAMCTAELPSLCLQPERVKPETGQSYRPLKVDGAIRLTGRDADGKAISVALPDAATVVAVRSHVAVRLSVPVDTIPSRLSKVEGVQVDRAVALLPDPADGDQNPLTVAEIDQAQGVGRTLANRLIADDAQRRLALEVSTYVINADVHGENAVAQVWQAALGRAAGSAAADDMELARFQYQHCRFSRDAGISPSLRACLQAQQDDTMQFIHNSYETALKVGS